MSGASDRRLRAFWAIATTTVALGSIGVASALGAFTVNDEQKFLPYNVFGNVTASCPHNQHIGFGGFKTDTKVNFGGDHLLWPASMGPVGNDTNKWSTVAASPSLGGGRLNSIAYCKAGKEPKVVKRTKLVLQSASNDEYRRVEATCPQGTSLIGGGWSARAPSPLYGSDGQPRVDIMGLQRTSNRTWQVSVVNYRTTKQSVTAIAICGKGSAPKTSVATEMIPVHTSKTATATCPGNSEVVFGGFQGDYDNFSGRNAFIFSFYRSSKRAISVRGGENGVAGLNKASKLQAFAYCR